MRKLPLVSSGLLLPWHQREETRHHRMEAWTESVLKQLQLGVSSPQNSHVHM